MPMNDLHILTWPIGQIGTPLALLVRASGMPPPDAPIPPLPEAVLTDAPAALDRWLHRLSSRLGVETEAVSMRYPEVDAFLQRAGPALLRLPTPTGETRILALLRSDTHSATVLDTHQQPRRVALTTLRAALCDTSEAPLRAELEQLLEAVGVPPRQRDRARQALLRERLGQQEVSGGWIIRLPAGAALWHLTRMAHLPLLLGGLLGAHALSYLLWLLSWGVLGRSVLAGWIDPGSIQAWALLLLSVIPFRLLSTWCQGELAIRAGVILKQRLLTGCLHLAPESVRQQGSGQMLGKVIEAETIETLAVNGGLLSLVAGLELLILMLVVGLGGAGVGQVALLALWLGVALLLGRIYVRQRQRWVDARLELTHTLIERMVGHRTRLAQQAPAEWHQDEDQMLTRYLRLSRAHDQSEALLLAVVPRGWLIVGLVGMIPLFMTNASASTTLIVGLGSTLFAYLSLQLLVQGVWSIVGAAVAWQQVGPLVATAHAAQQQAAEQPYHPALLAPPATTEHLIDAHQLLFRYREAGAPVLQNCTLTIQPGERLLLEGMSGSGKSTLAALLTGLREPHAGLLLLNGLDQRSIGAAEWRRQVAAAPQFHENHVLTGSFAFNLLLGRGWPPSNADLDLAEDICYELGLGDLLERMPGGLFQMVGDTGWQLSHGEKSRLYLARALLQGAQMVVLDESFAALDPDNLERALTCAMRRAPTLLVIAHP